MGDDAVWVVAFASLFVAVHLAPDLRPAKWALPGIAREWRKGAGVQTPSEGDPSFDVIDREFRLRRTSALAALVVLVACLPWLADLGWARRPIGVLLPFAIVLVAQLATRVVLAGGEALRERADGRPRLSTLTPGRLTHHLPAWWLALIGAIPVAAIVLAWRDVHALMGPSATPLLTGGLVATAAGLAAAAWLVRRPQVAHEPSDLRWNAFRRSRDVAQLVSLGPYLALAAVWFPRSFLDPDGPVPWWAWPLPLLAFAMPWVSQVLAQRRHRAVFAVAGQEEQVDAHR